MDQNNRIYSEEELLQFILGLDNIYLSKPWIIRWWWKPYHIALETLAMQLCNYIITNTAEKRDAVDFVENLLE